MYQIKRAGRREPVMEQHKCGELEYLTFPLLENTGIVKHLFSTRLGGVSEGIFSSMNLSFSRGDKPEHVLENYRRIGNVLGTTPDRMVASKQTHTTNIRLVTGEDCGKGIVFPADYDDIDGLITNEKGITLVTSYADCVPLYFVDPVHQAIGLAHSGWRGTVKQMGACMVEQMRQHFGTDPKDIYAAIGPSICQECYEVSEDVAEAFMELEKAYQEALRGINAVYGEAIVSPGRIPGKYQLDLWLANAAILVGAGIPAEQIAITDICTCHNSEYLYSHRASQGQRGGLCAFLMLKEN